MKRMFPPILFTVLICITLSSTSFAGGSCPSGVPAGVNSCFYIAANGSDANNGLTESTPWKHAPGMPNCSGTCAATNPGPGVGFILRGGDTYHLSASTNTGTDTAMGGSWSINATGSSGSPIYVGVDTGWPSSSWSRPIISMDNPLSTNVVGSCSYDDSTKNGLYIDSWTYVDNFEFTGKCWSSGSIFAGQNGTIFRSTGSEHTTVDHVYIHGWTVTSGAYDAHSAISGGHAAGASNNGQSYNVVQNSVIDGSDSSGPTANCSKAVYGAPCQSGWAISTDCYDVHNTVIRYNSDAIQCLNPTIIHDNLLEYNYSPINGLAVNGPHPNIVEGINGAAGPTGSRIFYFYNNVIRHSQTGVGIWVGFDISYQFNNVDYDSNLGANCFMESPWGNTNGGASATLYFYGNTIDNSSCMVQFYGQNGNSTTKWQGGTAYFANNHFIAFGNPGSLPNVYVYGPQANGTVKDNGGNVFQSESTANSQGYKPSNNYAPTSTSGATVGAGNDNASWCATFSTDNALCSGTSDGAMDNGGDLIYPAIPIVARAGSWDAGAYEYGSSTVVNPPTGLAAVVQ